MRRCLKVVSWSAICVLIGLAQVVTAAPGPTPDQLAKLKSADVALTKATNLIATKKFKDSAASVEEAVKTLTEMTAAADKDLQKLLDPRWARVKTVYSTLEIEGIELPKLEIPKPMPPEKPVAPPAGNTPAAPGTISFTKQVLPVLVAKCGRCHIQDGKGDTKFDTFAALMKGNKDGIVVMPGKGKGSRIYEVIESGAMPKGGKVSAAELGTLTKWIDEGAKFDGGNPAAPFLSLVPATPAKPDMPAMKLEVTAPTGKETISFSKDIAPVLAANCMSCHGDNNPGGRLNLTNFASMIRGGESGVPFIPGNTKESLLVRKISGSSAGKQMPLNKPPLSAQIIAKIEKWVAEGGKFDGPFGPAQRLDRLIEVVKAQGATHEVLSKQRVEIGERKWHNALSDVEPKSFAGKNFYVHGSSKVQTPQALADLAELQIPAVTKILGGAAETPLVKGRMTILAFANQIDYQEFAKSMDGKDRLPDIGGYWKYDGIDSMMAILPPANPKEYSLTTMISQYIASLYVSQQGTRTPTWFADGVGRVVAAKIDSKDPRVKRWESRVGEALATSKPDSLPVAGPLSEEQGALCYGFVNSQFMSNTTAFGSLMSALRKGDDFDQAVLKAYKATPQQMAVNYFNRRGK